ncbi:MAG: ATP-binding protein [Rhodospirillaceae bacterium]
MSDAELFNCILQPGFSTAAAVTNLSGRGVGMDVVKRAIDALRGTIEIKSEPGQGTTITLKLPLTLAIIDGLLVKMADERYIVPLSAVEECVELTRAEDQRMPIGLTQTHTRCGGSSQKIACVSAKPYHSAIYPLWVSALTR